MLSRTPLDMRLTVVNFELPNLSCYARALRADATLPLRQNRRKGQRCLAVGLLTGEEWCGAGRRDDARHVVARWWHPVAFSPLGLAH